jgi:hypothetical protein
MAICQLAHHGAPVVVVHIFLLVMAPRFAPSPLLPL